MAYMIPSTLKNLLDTTAGERKLFDLFRATLPDTCVVRYEMLLSERHYRPDYTLVDPHRGILVVEVKDWGISTIKKATANQFFVQYNSGAPQPQPNPNNKCQVYLRHIREALSAMPTLQGERLGELLVPLEYFVAFPNISKDEFVDQRLDRLIPIDHVLFKEDLIRSGRPFYTRYDQILPTLDPPLTKNQEIEIRRALLPDNGFAINIAGGFIPKNAEEIVVDDETVETLYLSLEQEQIAKSLGEGPRLLRGIAGTGKTLIMLYRAKLLAANNPDIKILILCWNISLANYMRQAYDKLQFQAKGQVVIQHFADFIRDLFAQRKIIPGDFDSPRFERQLESLRISESEKYDAVYIDEAQDFRREWIAFIYHNLLDGEPGARNLLVAADDAQRIYHSRDFSWVSLDIPMKGRSKILRTVYRNAARVWVFSAFLLQEKAAYLHEGDKDRVRFSEKGGYDPQLIECEDLAAQIEKAIEIIKVMHQSGFALRNVLLLYRHKRVDGFPLVSRLITRLNEEGIRSDWIAEDRDAKRTFEWDAETVKISTVHSAKGMDSPIVIILGAETFSDLYGPASGEEYDELRLMYVAMTRAREFLVILHTGNGGLVPQLRYCQEEYLKYRPSIIGLEEEGGDQQ